MRYELTDYEWAAITTSSQPITSPSFSSQQNGYVSR